MNQILYPTISQTLDHQPVLHKCFESYSPAAAAAVVVCAETITPSHTTLLQYPTPPNQYQRQPGRGQNEVGVAVCGPKRQSELYTTVRADAASPHLSPASLFRQLTEMDDLQNPEKLSGGYRDTPGRLKPPQRK